jgi:hypothetical protein
MKTADEQGFTDDSKSDWSDNEESRRRQLREDAGRSLVENLEEGLALSEFLSSFTGAARPR